MTDRTTPPAAVQRSHDSVRAVDRALDILLAFRPGDPPLAVADLLARVDLSRPTLYRLLATLQHRGFLTGGGEPQRFRPGPALALLAQAWRSTMSLPDLALPMMRRLWEHSRETVALFVPDDVQRVCVAELESPQPLSFRRGIGYRERLALGASGRAILAHVQLDEAALARLYDGLKVDAAGQARELEAVRQRGWASSRDELIEGAVAVAAPFFDRDGRIAGSLGVFGPGVRLTEARVQALVPLLREQAGLVSRQLGGADRDS